MWRMAMIDVLFFPEWNDVFHVTLLSIHHMIKFVLHYLKSIISHGSIFVMMRVSNSRPYVMQIKEVIEFH